MDVYRRDENERDDNDENKWTGQWEVNKSTLNGRLFIPNIGSFKSINLISMDAL